MYEENILVSWEPVGKYIPYHTQFISTHSSWWVARRFVEQCRGNGRAWHERHSALASGNVIFRALSTQLSVVPNMVMMPAITFSVKGFTCPWATFHFSILIWKIYNFTYFKTKARKTWQVLLTDILHLGIQSNCNFKQNARIANLSKLKQ